MSKQETSTKYINSSIEKNNEEITLRFDEISKRLKRVVFRNDSWQIEKEEIESKHRREITHLKRQLDNKQQEINDQAKQIKKLKEDIKNLQTKTYEDLINDENNKDFIKFVSKYKIQPNDKAHFIKKIDEMVVEIDKCVEMLQSK